MLQAGYFEEICVCPIHQPWEGAGVGVGGGGGVHRLPTCVQKTKLLYNLEVPN